MLHKICLITENFFPHVGGVEKYFLDVAKGLIKNNYEVRILTSNSGNKKTTGHHVFEGIDVFYYNWFSLSDHAIPKVNDLVEHIKWCDIVHTTTYTAGPVANYVGKKLHKPVIIIVHEVLGKKWHWIEPNILKALCYRFIEYFCVKQNYNYFLCNSYATEKDLLTLQKNKSKIKTIYLSVDINNLLNIQPNREKLLSYFEIPQNTKTFLYYGRPGQPKGIFIYLEAIKKLVTENLCPQDFRFLFLLSKEPHAQRNKFIEKINKYALEKYIIIRPSVPYNDLYKIVKASNYIVIPSITEGFGYTCVESCTMSCKVIHSSGGSLPEVAFGKTMQFENRDINSLCNVLLDVIHNKEFQESKPKVFSLDKEINELINVYNYVINTYSHTRLSCTL